MLGSATMAAGQPGQAVVPSAPTRIHDSMLRNLPQQKALLWNFYTMSGPSSFWLL